MSSLPITVASFSVPKAGNEATENEDAWAVHLLVEDCFRVAVADGATESSFSQLWAALLVEAFTRSAALDEEELMEMLPVPRAVWAEYVGKRPLPWYAQEKAKMGAFAALLGLTVDTKLKRWHALAVGDCNLFQYGNRCLIESFPLTRSGEFGMSPMLLGTSQESDKEVAALVRATTGTVRPGDALFLASDALAAWLLSKAERCEPVWRDLVDLDEGKFEALVTWARSSDGLHNDDTTLVRVVFGDDDDLA